MCSFYVEVVRSQVGLQGREPCMQVPADAVGHCGEPGAIRRLELAVGGPHWRGCRISGRARPARWRRCLARRSRALVIVICARQAARGSQRREFEVDDAGVGPVELVARLREVARAEQNRHVWRCAAAGNVARAVSLHRVTELVSHGRSASRGRCPCPGGGPGREGLQPALARWMTWATLGRGLVPARASCGGRVIDPAPMNHVDVEHLRGTGRMWPNGRARLVGLCSWRRRVLAQDGRACGVGRPETAGRGWRVWRRRQGQAQRCQRRAWCAGRPPHGGGRRRALHRRSLHTVLACVRCVLLQEVRDSRVAERASMLASRCTSCRRRRGEMVAEGGQGVAGFGAVALRTPRDGREVFTRPGVAFGSTIWASVLCVVVIRREQAVHDRMRRRLRVLRRRGRRAQGSRVLWAQPLRPARLVSLIGQCHYRACLRSCAHASLQRSQGTAPCV